MDAAFLDNITLPLEPATLTVLSFTKNTRLELQGQPNQTYVIQSSSDLEIWTDIAREVAVNGVIQITDPEPPTAPARFYRAFIP